jgi:hypothetical protein
MRAQRRNAERITRDFQFILTQLCQVFHRRGLHAVLLSHWEQYCQADRYCAGEFVQDLLGAGVDRETYARTVRLLEASLYERNWEMGTDLLCSLVEFVKATPDDRRAAGLVSALADLEDQCYGKDEIRAALSVTDDNSKAARILLALDEDYELVGPVTLLGNKIQDARLRRIVEQAVLGKDKKLLLRLGTCTQLVTDLGLPVPDVPEFDASLAWIERYPPALHVPLRQLGRVAEDAPAIADRLLSKDFPGTESLHQEVVTLRARLALTDDAKRRQRIAKRLSNLEGRIRSPRDVTPQRLANLAERVTGRVEHQVVMQYLRDNHLLVAKQLKSVYGAGRLTEDLFEPPFDRLLSGILQLQGTTRRLGLRLLWHRLSDTSGDFRLEPKNVAFREKIEAKGINMEPWLSDESGPSATTRNGEQYRLFFTREVLDYLMMGFHFDTCLSPGSCNFFSTIANAVDINKQVLYGKTDSGRIVGRCLFTLTDQGTILTYHRYSHDASDGFAESVDEFAQQLAQAMGTRVATSGQVATLVARDWYDDGAVPMESALDFQSPEGIVRTLLRTSEPLSVIEDLRDVMGTDQAVKSTLGSILFATEFADRPTIVGPFVATYGLDDDLGFNERFRLAILAHQAGQTDSAETVLASLRPNSLPIRLKRDECGSCCAFHGIGTYQEVIDLLIDYNPTLALRTIRATRPNDVRRDMDEKNRQRRSALAKIHRRLGRDQLSVQLAGEGSPV